jgi:hypothetical protein
MSGAGSVTGRATCKMQGPKQEGEALLGVSITVILEEFPGPFKSFTNDETIKFFKSFTNETKTRPREGVDFLMVAQQMCQDDSQLSKILVHFSLHCTYLAHPCT